MGLKDFGEDTARTSKGKLAFMRRATAESRKRSIGSGEGVEIWDRLKKARNELKNFGVPYNEFTRALLMNDGFEILAHEVWTGWSKKGKAFPFRENVRCQKWSLDKEGHWIDTGKRCLLCEYFGQDPRIVILFAVLDLFAYDKKARPDIFRMEVTHTGTITAITDGVEAACIREKREPSPRFACFKVTRGGEERALRYGDSWTFLKFPTKEEAAELGMAKFLESVPNWEEGWPFFNEDELLYFIRRDKELRDSKKDGRGYDQRVAAKILAKDFPSKFDESKATGDGGTEGTEPAKPTDLKSFGEDLDDSAGGASDDGPSLSDLDDLDSVLDGAAAGTADGEDGGDGDDDIDPYSDEDL